MAEQRVQRRLAAILAADVVAYSQLMGEDEEGTRAVFNDILHGLIEPRIADHGGRTVKTMGDGLLVEFTSVVDAVQCAVEIQAGIAKRNAGEPEDRRMEYRIGVNLGDVIIEGDDIHGDGVNVAARLEALADPGGVFVSDKVFEEVDGKLDIGFEDLGPQDVKNIPHPVSVFRVLPAGQKAHARGRKTAPAPRRLVAIAAACLVVLAIAALAWWQPWKPAVAPTTVAGAALPLPKRPSIAVLPFNNLSDDRQQEYFSDGITEDIITDLSKVSGLFVIARNSSFKYKGKAVDVRDVASAFGVRFVLEGSVRKAGARVRITAQLIDGRTGSHVWAERYDRDLTDVFAVQDEVTRKIVSALTVNLTQADKDRLSRRGTDSIEAYDYVLRGQAQGFRFTKESNDEARRLYQKAVDLDPNYARGYTGLAWTHLNEFRLGWSKNERQSLDQAFAFAERAVKLDEQDALAHTVLSDVYLWTQRHAQALAAAERAVALSPNDADTISHISSLLAWAGEPEKSIREVHRAMRLNPDYPMLYIWYLGHAHFVSGRYKESAAAFERCRQRNPNFAPARIYLAASYGYLGRVEDARAEVAAAQKLALDWSLAELNKNLPYKDRSNVDRLVEGLNKAGP